MARIKVALHRLKLSKVVLQPIKAVVAKVVRAALVVNKAVDKVGSAVSKVVTKADSVAKAQHLTKVVLVGKADKVGSKTKRHSHSR